MIHDISVQKLVQFIKRRERKFTNVSIEDFNFTLRDYDLEDVEFENCFVNFNLENCNLKNARFNFCNLKTISIQNCSMKNCYISSCHIESITITGRGMDQIVFGTNYAYGITLNPDQSALYVKSGILKNR
ncbi:pentapeptide repeat-containing protein [Leptospira borgpetersenii]|uniref:Pentapeptide repeat protein n=2 Tax=Leptospira borgpetersenii TaxID=174 RepID=M3F8W6_LEPBO|nr:pentapeptide repeat-containing protein [Leptospira borgpetersenii]EMF98372.1 pentapeptide repeat protein [Leptospira borgpetersenii str. 200701203]EKP12797.1 pentapeptide repeat protein [Leptospira borgpetersenii str. 200801926]ENO64764.1 pentapeptide repeat protein [Leptospira borgpetersenii serovar Mini str. 201000851]URD69753.1 pentapeptide repeat-containing protein [Leptospira borgpetersenii]UVD72928.1 pentapeptide repeat-containing protein [Leptospira borgpetersenii]